MKKAFKTQKNTKKSDAKANIFRLASLLMFAVLVLMTGSGFAKSMVEDKERVSEICRKAASVQPPIGDLPTQADAKTLKDCNSYKLFYGIGQDADPEKARLCAYQGVAKRSAGTPDHEKRSSANTAFTDEDVLMTVYTNGVGAKRNFPVAIKLACDNYWAPAEREYRVLHLDELRRQNWQGTDFSVCDDITSGYMMGWCTQHAVNLQAENKQKQFNDILSAWLTSKQFMYQENYKALRTVSSAYFETRSSYEVDMSGTARAALAIREEEAMYESDLELLQFINAGVLPIYTKEDYDKADRELNIVYQKIQSPENAFSRTWNGTVNKDGIKRTQREWIHYRDAWVMFCQRVYPEIDANSIKTVLTRVRTEMLREFIADN